MPISPRARTIAVASLMYAAVSFSVVGAEDSLAFAYRCAWFAASCLGVLWATDSASLAEAFRWFPAHRLAGNYVLIFAAAVAAYALYKGASAGRVAVETVHTFFFFWACAAVGELYRSRYG